TATATLSSLGIAVVLLAAFVTIEIKSKNPLLPTRVIPERNRGAPSSARSWPSQPCSGCSYSSPTTSRGTWATRPSSRASPSCPSRLGSLGGRDSAGSASAVLVIVQPRQAPPVVAVHQGPWNAGRVHMPRPGRWRTRVNRGPADSGRQHRQLRP